MSNGYAHFAGLQSSKIITVGDDAENPSILNRNDAKGSWGIWAQKEIFGYWNVHVAQEGDYQVKCVFEEPLTDDGRMNVRLGRVQRAVMASGGSREVVLKKIHLPEGDISVEAGFRNSKTWRVEFPFYLEIERI